MQHQHNQQPAFIQVRVILADFYNLQIKSSIKNQLVDTITNAIHGNWIPAIPAGMTALRFAE